MYMGKSLGTMPPHIFAIADKVRTVMDSNPVRLPTFLVDLCLPKVIVAYINILLLYIVQSVNTYIDTSLYQSYVVSVSIQQSLCACFNFPLELLTISMRFTMSMFILRPLGMFILSYPLFYYDHDVVFESSVTR